MSPLARFQRRVNAAIKAFQSPGLVRGAKSYYGGYAPMYGADLTTGASAMWSKWGAAAAVLVNPAMFACVTTRAETIVKLSYRVVDRDSRKPVDEKQEPLMRALAAYQRYYRQSFFQEWMYDRDITGEVFIEPLRNPISGRVMGIDLLSTLNVTPVSLDGYSLAGYEYSAGARFVRLPLDALIYDRNTIARATAVFGYSPVLNAIGSDTAGVMQAAGKAMLAYFNNDGVAATIIQPSADKEHFSESEVEYMRRMYQPIKHASGKYATAIIPDRAEVLTVQQPDLMKWAELLASVEPKIYTAFRTPRSIAGDSDSTRYQASPADRQNYDDVMHSVADDIAGVINNALLPLLYDDPEPSVEFEFETASLDHIDPEERQAARDAYLDGTITLNEYREVMGYEPIGDKGNVYLPKGDADRTPDISQAFRDGVITVNEYRAAMGRPTTPNGDSLFLPAGVAVVPVEALGQLQPKPTYLPFQSPQTTIQQAEYMAESAGMNPPQTPPETSNPESEAPVAVVDQAAPPQLPANVPERDSVEEVEAFGKYLSGKYSAKRAFIWYTVDADTARCIESDAASAAPDAVKSVLGTWQTTLRARRGETDYATKAFADLPDTTQLYLKALQALGFSDDDRKAAGEMHYAGIVGAKALSAVRASFEAECARLFARAIGERIGKARFERDFFVTLFRYARLAMTEGYADGGVIGHESTASDDEWLLDFNNEQRTFVANVAAQLYADDELTEAEVRGKPTMWWNLSVNPAYNEGVARASKDGLGEFNWGSTAESCIDCTTLNGKRYRFSEWLEHFGGELVPSHKTACGGFNCKCRIRPARGKRTPGDIPPLHGYRKSDSEIEVHAHDHA